MTASPVEKPFIYSRCVYGMDRRNWVKAADENIPAWLAAASKLQEEAAILSENWRSMTLAQQKRYSSLQATSAAIYFEARSLVLRAMYYAGMREANRD